MSIVVCWASGGLRILHRLGLVLVGNRQAVLERLELEDVGEPTVASKPPPALLGVAADLVAPEVSDDIALVTDGNSIYPSYARSLGVRHERLSVGRQADVRSVPHPDSQHSAMLVRRQIRSLLRHLDKIIPTITCTCLSEPSSWGLRLHPAWNPL